jgi:hypothetical protein
MFPVFRKWLAGWLTYAMPWRRVDDKTFPTTVLKLHVDFRMYVHMYCVFHVAGGDFSLFRRYLPRYG